MSARDRAFRRLVADLAQAAPDDVRGVLDHLDPAHRDEVRAMLAAYAGESIEAKPGPRSQAPPTAGLSPWLQARIMSSGGDPSFAMTPVALATLRACAPAPGRQPPPRETTPPRRTGGLNGLLTRLRVRP